METIIVNHLKCSPPRRSLFGFGKTIIQDYSTKKGIVREYSHRDKMPKYKLMSTRKPVNIEFI